MNVVDTIGPFQGYWRVLSNFSPFPAKLGEVWYPTAEHAFQAAKTVDPVARQQILHAESPGRAKRLGRQAPMRPGWQMIRAGVMFTILVSKFSEPDPREFLLSTGDARLVEYNDWHDNLWGICTCGRPSCVTATGENLLGGVLMEVRAEVT